MPCRGANLTHVETNGGASPKTTPTAGVNLIVQARIQGGSPGGSPLRRSKRQSSAEIISGAKQNPSPAVSNITAITNNSIYYALLS